jgi:hypothetical protein
MSTEMTFSRHAQSGSGSSPPQVCLALPAMVSALSSRLEQRCHNVLNLDGTLQTIEVHLGAGDDLPRRDEIGLERVLRSQDASALHGV